MRSLFRPGGRQLEVKAPADLPLLVMAWKAPRLNDPRKDVDPYALEMLAQILDGHEAARLPAALVREQQVARFCGRQLRRNAPGPRFVS